MATTKRKRASRETPRAVPLALATAQRARLAAAQADLAELKAAEKRGALLDAGEVEREWAGRRNSSPFIGGLAAPARFEDGEYLWKQTIRSAGRAAADTDMPSGQGTDGTDAIGNPEHIT
jgi:hypothetical protein